MCGARPGQPGMRRHERTASNRRGNRDGQDVYAAGAAVAPNGRSRHAAVGPDAFAIGRRVFASRIARLAKFGLAQAIQSDPDRRQFRRHAAALCHRTCRDTRRRTPTVGRRRPPTPECRCCASRNLVRCARGSHHAGFPVGRTRVRSRTVAAGDRPPGIDTVRVTRADLFRQSGTAEVGQPVGPHQVRFRRSRHRFTAGATPRGLVPQSPGLHAADDGTQPALPAFRGRGTRKTPDAARTRLAADDRERLQPDCLLDRQGVGHLAIHPGHRQALRARTELVVRRSPGRHRSHLCRARLPAEALRRFRRLATGARRLQLGRRLRGKSSGTQRAQGPVGRLRKPAHAGRNRQLCSQAPGGEEHHCRSGPIRRRARRYSQSALFHQGRRTSAHRLQACRPIGRSAARGVPLPQSRTQPPGDHLVGPDPAAARGQGRRLHRQPRSQR